jgi:hypothetical protein
LVFRRRVDFLTRFLAVTLGAGVQWGEAYDAVNQNGRMIVGGALGGLSVLPVDG